MAQYRVIYPSSFR